MILTNSQIQSWLGCRRYYKFAYIDLLKPVEISPALRIGSAVHYALRYHYLGHDDGILRFSVSLHRILARVSEYLCKENFSASFCGK